MYLHISFHVLDILGFVVISLDVHPVHSGCYVGELWQELRSQVGRDYSEPRCIVACNIHPKNTTIDIPDMQSAYNVASQREFLITLFRVGLATKKDETPI